MGRSRKATAARGLPALLGEVHKGRDPLPLSAWADLLEESGDAEGAGAVRAFPALGEEAVRYLAPWVEAGVAASTLRLCVVSRFSRWAGAPAWWAWGPVHPSGDAPGWHPRLLRDPRFVESRRNNTSGALGVVMRRWADLSPALGWLAASVGLARARISSSVGPADLLTGGADHVCDLRRRPLPRLEGVEVYDVTFSPPRRGRLDVTG